jgi:hypothetical protein
MVELKSIEMQIGPWRGIGATRSLWVASSIDRGMMRITRTSSATRDAAFAAGGLKHQHIKWSSKTRRDKTST